MTTNALSRILLQPFMNHKISKKLGLVLVLGVSPFVGGCDQPTATLAQAAAAESQPAVAPAVSTAPGTPATPPPTESVEPAAKPAPAELEKPLPENIKATPALAEIIKMANAGVDESVMLAYVTNTTSTFSVGSEEIIYLNDIGVPSPVITSMIHHDQALKSQAAAAAVASTPAPIVTTPEVNQPTEVPPPVEAPLTPPAEYAAEAYSPPPEQINVGYFYDSLAPYGSWVNIDGYGRCWQPTVVVHNPRWRPYSDCGRWVYSDCGWYWASDYSWGWAPFHYGRWFPHARYGWCWAPDTVWGPSWVTWRYSDSYCGWAPLPPAAYYSPGIGFSYYNHSVGFGFDFGLAASCYTFVPTHRICDRRPSHYALHHKDVTKVIQKTKVVNNITVKGDNNNVVVNNGISPQQISRVTKTDVPRVTLRDTQSAGSRRERFDPSNRTLAVYRPRVSDRDAARRGQLATTSSTSTSGTGSRTSSGTATAPTTTTQNERNSTVSGGGNVARSNNRLDRDNSDFRRGSARPDSRMERSAPSATTVVTTPNGAERPATRAGTSVSEPAPSSPAPTTTATQPVGDRNSSIARNRDVRSNNPSRPDTLDSRGGPAVKQTPGSEKSAPVATAPLRPQGRSAQTTAPAPGQNASATAKEHAAPNSAVVSGRQVPRQEVFNRYSPTPAGQQSNPGANNNISRWTQNQNRMAAPATPSQNSTVTAPQTVRPETSRWEPRGGNQIRSTPSQPTVPSRNYGESTYRTPAYSAPNRPQMNSTPAPSRQYSAPQPSRQYSAPQPSYSAPQRQSTPQSYSAPQRQSAPQARAESRGGGGGNTSRNERNSDSDRGRGR